MYCRKRNYTIQLYNRKTLCYEHNVIIMKSQVKSIQIQVIIPYKNQTTLLHEFFQLRIDFQWIFAISYPRKEEKAVKRRKVIVNRCTKINFQEKKNPNDMLKSLWIFSVTKILTTMKMKQCRSTQQLNIFFSWNCPKYN